MRPYISVRIGPGSTGSFTYSWVSWEELVVALCQQNRIVIQSSLEPVCLNDSLRCKLPAQELCFIVIKPFVRGRYVLRSHFIQYKFIKVHFWQLILFLKSINEVKHTHTNNSNILLQGLRQWGAGCFTGAGLENASSQLQEHWNRIVSEVLKTWYSSTGFPISFWNRAVIIPLKF